MCLLGAKDAEIAKFLEVSVSTLIGWKTEHPEFGQAIVEGKILADANVADSMYKRATGYSHYDVDIRVCDGKIVKTDIVKHYPPDVSAARHWLTCRRRKDWTAAQEIVGRGGGPIEITDPERKVDDMEIARRLAFFLSQAAEKASNADDQKGEKDQNRDG